jgi:hypothetical protein
MCEHNPRMRSLLGWSCFVGVVTVFLACGSDGESRFAGGGKRDSGSGSGSSGSSVSFGQSDAQPSEQPPEQPATDVEAIVTTDNAFSFGYGTDSVLNTFIRGEASGGGEIFNCPVGFGPAKYTVPAAQAPTGAYLYIIAWADNAVSQGTLAQFKRLGGQPVYSGDGAWQVCAVGKPYANLADGPDQATVNASIGDCNKGTPGATYSKGWVTTNGAVTPGAIGLLAFGETNDDPGGTFPIVCQMDDAGVSGIDAVARWMWFDPQDGSSPFFGNANNRTKTFLIFRLPADALPVPVK